MAKSISLALLHQGLVRTKNEDNLYVLDTWVPIHDNREYERSAASSDSLQFYAVTDGMGGAGIGDLAAQTVLQLLDQQRRQWHSGSRFDFVSFARDFVDRANREVCRILAPYQGLPVGTTFSMLAVEHETAYTVSLGNSRIYLYRDNQLYRLTEDHIGTLPDRRQLTRYLGLFQDNAMVDAENMTRTVLNKGDIFLLTSDGITDYLSDDMIAERLAAPVAFVQQIRQLRNLALEAGGGDNIALIGVKIQNPSAREPAVRDTAKIAGGHRPPKIRGDAAALPNSRQHRWLRPLLFFLLFILLGLLLGKIIFSLPGWINSLLGRS